MNKKLNIDLSIVESSGLYHRDAILMLYYQLCKEFSIEKTRKRLVEAGLMIDHGFGIYELSNDGRDLIMKILGRSNKKVCDDDRLDNLANRIMAEFPEGKKYGTAYYWRDSKKTIKKKLQKYLQGHKHTDDQIIQATNKYVKSFNNDYKYMQLLKYFIEKDGSSQLESYVENIDNVEEDLGPSWLHKII